VDTQSIGAILSLAFALGLLHALDADHIMAVSSFASNKPTLRRSLAFCLRWALGHGATLLLIGGTALLLGITLPAHWAVIAEQLIGLILIGLGSWVLYTLRSRGMVLSRHQHPGLPHHMHWQSVHHNHPNNSNTHNSHFNTEHGAVMVGMLHGIAGSAPLLALIPVIQSESSMLGIGYLFIFSGGVFWAMLLFGGLLGSCYQHLLGWSHRAFTTMRAALGVGAIGYGSFMLMTISSSS